MSVAIQTFGTFRFFFPEEDWAESFNCYEVQRSRFGEAGPWEDLHELNGYAPASFFLSPLVSYDVDGLTLELLVNRVTTVVVQFSGTSLGDVMQAFNSSMPSVLVASAASGVVSTLEVGFASSILATPSDAWTKLRKAQTFFFGTAACPALVSGQEAYVFTDPAAEPGWYYRTRYRNRATGATGEWSIAIEPTANVGVDPAELIKGVLFVTDPRGLPVAGVMVFLDVEADPTNPGMLPMQIQQATNDLGYVGILVRRGVLATLAIAGVPAARKIRVPLTGDTFDLGDPSLSTQPDAYRVQVPDIKVGERRSM